MVWAARLVSAGGQHAKLVTGANLELDEHFVQVIFDSARAHEQLGSCQSFQASSKESFTLIRRCSGLSTRKMPPNAQTPCPPSLAAFSCSPRRPSYRGWSAHG